MRGLYEGVTGGLSRRLVNRRLTPPGSPLLSLARRWLDVQNPHFRRRQIDFDQIRRDRFPDIAGEVYGLDLDVELVRQAIRGHVPDVAAAVRKLLSERFPLAVELFGVG